MSIQKLRLEKGWSQEHLAQVSGLSVRTVQRIERGQKPGLESMKCLAAVFETDVAILMQEHNMTTMTKSENANPSAREKEEAEAAEAKDYVDNMIGFHWNWISALIVIPALYFLNMKISPDAPWVFAIVVAWGGAIILHALVIFGIFGMFNAKWRQRKIDERLGRGNSGRR